jgi:hypothetical protein
MLKAVEETSTGTLHLIDAIREAMEVTANIMKKQSGKLYSKDFLELLFEKPYIRIGDVVDKWELFVRRKKAEMFYISISVFTIF